MWRRLVYWQGAYGYARLVITNYTAQPSSTPGTLDGTLAGMSNAGIVQIAEGTVTSFMPAPVVATYPSVAQAARITCLDTGLNAFILLLPAPKLAEFLADGVTMTTSALAAVQTAALLDGVVNPSTGLLLATCFTGVLNGPANPGQQLTGV